ncbi:MAG: 4Fe-4S binding protein [Oscillospiraceae bacterium]|nr:4Fe-4S binding protein [Oscillospiraceae bacterium]
MMRKVIEIDKAKCTGCGQCAAACHQGAIGLVDGKAELLREDYCDGLGICLPACPAGAIRFVEKEVSPQPMPPAGGCPGTMEKTMEREETKSTQAAIPSQLRQWPVQIKLVPPRAPYFSGANLLVAADCAAYAYGSFHSDYMKGAVTIIGCPKLDAGDYSEKLTDILTQNEVSSVTVARMEVPCCAGIENAARAAVAASGKPIPLDVVTISTDGVIID